MCSKVLHVTLALIVIFCFLSSDSSLAAQKSPAELTSSQVNKIIQAHIDDNKDVFLKRHFLVTAQFTGMKIDVNAENPKFNKVRAILRLPDYCAVDIVCSFTVDQIDSVTSMKAPQTVTIVGKLDYITRGKLQLEGCRRVVKKKKSGK
jgi:hypothetical protein